MCLGCLVDSGWPVASLQAAIERLNLPAGHWAVDAKPVMKGPLHATQVNVHAAEGHHHRHLSDIRTLIAAADLPETVKDRAVAVFARLAEAEAKVHGSTSDKIHFHEVGAMDAIIDIVGTVMGLHELNIEELYASAVPLGEGWTKAGHGRIPLPAPATLELLTAVAAPTCPAQGPGEWLTPTGAALLAELAKFEQPAMRLRHIGVGAGQADCAWPNVARLWIGDCRHQAGTMVQLETNIDDMSPLLFAPICESLFAAGARDVWLTPIQMKKGRPAITLSVLADASREAELSELILRQTTTFGVRVHGVQHRREADRQLRQIVTAFGPVNVKLKLLNGQLLGAMPEYEDCRALAASTGKPFAEVYAAAGTVARDLVQKALNTER